MADEKASSLPLSGGAKDLIAIALRKCQEGHNEAPVIDHWLLALLERNGAMAAGLVENLDINQVLEQAKKRLQEGQAGATLPEPALVAEAVQVAEQRKKTQVTERDLAVAIL